MTEVKLVQLFKMLNNQENKTETMKEVKHLEQMLIVHYKTVNGTKGGPQHTALTSHHYRPIVHWR